MKPFIIQAAPDVYRGHLTIDPNKEYLCLGFDQGCAVLVAEDGRIVYEPHRWVVAKYSNGEWPIGHGTFVAPGPSDPTRPRL